MCLSPIPKNGTRLTRDEAARESWRRCQWARERHLREVVGNVLLEHTLRPRTRSG